MATTNPKIIDIIIETTEIQIVVVKPLSKNLRFVSPSILFGDIMNQPNSWPVQDESVINKSKKNIFFTFKVIEN